MSTSIEPAPCSLRRVSGVIARHVLSFRFEEHVELAARLSNPRVAGRWPPSSSVATSGHSCRRVGAKERVNAPDLLPLPMTFRIPRSSRRRPPEPPDRSGNPRPARVGKPCSRRESRPIPSQAGRARTGLSRRRSRVRVPSRPLHESPARRTFDFPGSDAALRLGASAFENHLDVSQRECQRTLSVIGCRS